MKKTWDSCLDNVVSGPWMPSLCLKYEYNFQQNQFPTIYSDLGNGVSELWFPHLPVFFFFH